MGMMQWYLIRYVWCVNLFRCTLNAESSGPDCGSLAGYEVHIHNDSEIINRLLCTWVLVPGGLLVHAIQICIPKSLSAYQSAV